MLNCDYKIAAKSIATRLRNVLPPLINNDQTVFFEGRFIGENVKLINSVIDYAEKQNIPGLLFFVDFEKAFDTLEWTFIEKTLSFNNDIQEAVYKTIAGLPTFFSLVEGSDKAVPYRHTALFYV